MKHIEFLLILVSSVFGVFSIVFKAVGVLNSTRNRICDMAGELKYGQKELLYWSDWVPIWWLTLAALLLWGALLVLWPWISPKLDGDLKGPLPWSARVMCWITALLPLGSAAFLVITGIFCDRPSMLTALASTPH